MDERLAPRVKPGSKALGYLKRRIYVGQQMDLFMDE